MTRTAPFLGPGDVITLADRPVVVCTVGAPYRDPAGTRRVVVTGTGDGASTVACPVRICTEFAVT